MLRSGLSSHPPGGSGGHSTEYKLYKPLRLLVLLLMVVTTLSVLSQLLAKWAGVYWPHWVTFPRERFLVISRPR